MGKTIKSIKDVKDKKEDIEEVEEIEEEKEEKEEEREKEREKKNRKKVKAESKKDDEASEDDEYEEVNIEDRVIGIEKKVNAVMIISVIIMIIVVVNFIMLLGGGVGSSSSSYSDETDTTNSESTDSGSYDTSAFKSITAQDIANLSKNKTIVLWIGRQGCGYCGMFAPNAKEAQNQTGVPIYYMDLGKILDFSNYPQTVAIADEEAYDIMINLSTDNDNKDVMNKFGNTPMMLVIKNNRVVGNLIGSQSVDAVVQLIKDEEVSK